MDSARIHKFRVKRALRKIVFETLRGEPMGSELTKTRFEEFPLFWKLCLAWTLSFGASQNALSAPPKILVHGHRGARMVRPENTLAAFKYALDVGVDVLELDLTVTKDNILVVTHDLTINPKICKTIVGKNLTSSTPIRALTLKEVKQLDCGSLRNPRFKNQVLAPGESIPTFEEVLLLVKQYKRNKYRKVQFNVETKILPGKPELTPKPKDFVKLILDLLHKYKVTSRTILQSFDSRTLSEMRKIAPEVRISQLISRNFLSLDSWALKSKQNIDIISPNHLWVTQNLVRQMHENGIKVVPYTANTPEDWERLIKIGVDGIITDDPAALLKFLKR